MLPIRYSERTPSPAAARLVLSYWSFQADSSLPPGESYTVFPDGCASISSVRTSRGASFVALIGPRSTHFNPPFSAGTRIWGIRLWPDAIAPALGLDARSLRNHFGGLLPGIRKEFGELDRVLPRSDHLDVVFPALDDWANRTLASAPDPDPRIRAAIRSIVARRGECSMEQVAKDAALGLRHLQRLFPDATGLTLREFARVRRLREALAMRLASTSKWSEIAAGAGFVDHSHLTREFISLTGIAPSTAERQMRSTSHREVRP